MPIPKPQTGEAKTAFISRCISFLENEGSKPSDQIQAICFSQWKKASKTMTTTTDGKIQRMIEDKFVNFMPQAIKRLRKLNKSITSRYTRNTLFTYSENSKNITILGDPQWDKIDGLETTDDSKFAERYGMLIIRTDNNFNTNYEFQLLPENITLSNARDQAITLVENNKNSIDAIDLARGTIMTFANRPVFESFETYYYVSKAKLAKEKSLQERITLTNVQKDANVSKNEITVERTCLFKTTNDEKRLVYGIVYEPYKKDSDGDWTTPEEIENAAHNFLPQALLDKNHDNDDFANSECAVVECYIAPVTYTINNELVKQGSWVLVTKVFSDDVWEDVKTGEFTGFSFEGKAQRVGA